MPDRILTPDETQRMTVMVHYLPNWVAHRKVTQRNIAGTLNVSEATVSKWLRGKQGMSLDKFVQFAEMLGVQPIELLYPPDQEATAKARDRALQIVDQLDPEARTHWLAVGEAMANSSTGSENV